MRGRFAPSPSGEMHLGNAFSALLAWLSVRSRGGTMVLRLEDLDPDRCRRSYCDALETDLRWLGLDWDEGGSAGGEAYYQSRRDDFYHAALEKLREADLLYTCYCSRGELHAAGAPHNSDGDVIYSGACRALTQEQRAEKEKTRRPAVRIRVPAQEISFVDGLQGKYGERLDLHCGDFILRRSDGVYAYQLAVVVDDAWMGIDEVVRGRDLLSSTPRQMYLQRLLGYATPSYVHVPLLTAPDGRRLSKREADLSIAALRAQGVSAEQVIGWLACAAGLTETNQPVSARELIHSFAWEKITCGDIVINRNI